eukprot:8723099-Pyramimonas_sp.AAC.1
MGVSPTVGRRALAAPASPHASPRILELPASTVPLTQRRRARQRSLCQPEPMIFTYHGKFPPAMA